MQYLKFLTCLRGLKVPFLELHLLAAGVGEQNVKFWVKGQSLHRGPYKSSQLIFVYNFYSFRKYVLLGLGYLP